MPDFAILSLGVCLFVQ